MISTVYIRLLQFIFLSLTTDAMSGFLQDTTDLPDDGKELKELESSRQDSHGFPMPSPYRSNFFSFRRTPEELPDFAYHLDRLGSKTGSSWDTISPGRSVADLDGRGDSITPEEDDDGDVSKRGSRRFKQSNQKFRFDPALNRLGLGKRDNSDRPKYNPGWKFIGLGKRIMPFLRSMNPAAFSVDRMDQSDFRAGTPDALIPYYRVLAMHDVSMFLDDVNERLNGIARRNSSSQSSSSDHLNLGPYNPTGAEETSQKVKHSNSGFLAVGPQNENPERSNKPQFFFTRSRKPTSMWRNKSKPMYDPGWLMTGLGK